MSLGRTPLIREELIFSWVINLLAPPPQKKKGGIGLSLVDDTPQELIYVSLSKLNVDTMMTDMHQHIIFTVANFQVDNQIYGSKYPVLIYPVFKVRPTQNKILRRPSS